MKVLGREVVCLKGRQHLVRFAQRTIGVVGGQRCKDGVTGSYEREGEEVATPPGIVENDGKPVGELPHLSEMRERRQQEGLERRRLPGCAPALGHEEGDGLLRFPYGVALVS